MYGDTTRHPELAKPREDTIFRWAHEGMRCKPKPRLKPKPKPKHKPKPKPKHKPKPKPKPNPNTNPNLDYILGLLEPYVSHTYPLEEIQEAS